MSSTAYEELYIGMQESFRKIITDGEAALYAGLVGDNSIFAMADGAADCTQAPKPRANHLLLVGIVGGLLNTRFPGPGSQCTNIQFEILAPVFTGDCIETVIELNHHDAEKHLATFKIQCYNQKGDQVITGQAVMLVPLKI
jgi:acyl dehydratase